jgi:hypothetical protein
MAGQRRGEPGRDGERGGARLRGLGLLLTLAVLAGCTGDPKGVGPFEPGSGDEGSGAGGGSAAQALVGTWRNVTVIEVPGDLQTWTTTWRFEEGGMCLQAVETVSLAEGVPRVTERECGFTVASDEVTITFLGGGTATFDFSFASFDPDRLVLGGFEYDRLG